jgi:hypothetical protein
MVTELSTFSPDNSVKIGAAKSAKRAPTAPFSDFQSLIIFAIERATSEFQLRSCRAVGAGPHESMKQFVHLLGRQRHLVLDPPDE